MINNNKKTEYIQQRRMGHAEHLLSYNSCCIKNTYKFSIYSNYK